MNKNLIEMLAAINAAVYQNGTRAITGTALNGVLLSLAGSSVLPDDGWNVNSPGVPATGGGRVTMANASGTVTGVGTQFTDFGPFGMDNWYLFFVNDGTDDYLIEVDTINSDTELTILKHYASLNPGTDLGTTWTGASGTFDFYLFGNANRLELSALYGFGNLANSIRAATLGTLNRLSGSRPVAIGDSNAVLQTDARAVGRYNLVDAPQAAAIGDSNTVTQSGATAIGKSNTLSGIGAVGVGDSHTIESNLGGAVLGQGNVVRANNPQCGFFGGVGNEFTTGPGQMLNVIGIACRALQFFEAGLQDCVIMPKALFTELPTYADDAAAGTGGLIAGQVYKTATGELRIKL